MRRNKYGNTRVVVDGIKFDSKKEARRYQELKIMVKAGLINQLELQPKFDLIVNGKKCGFYKADFQYVELDQGKQIVEDVKGMKTPVYNLKKKLVKAIYGIAILET